MIYLSGHVRPQLQHPRLGFLNTPQMGDRRIPPGVPWAADNGRFSAPERYTDDGFLAWLDEQRKDTCLFATAPDVLGDHAATVEMSAPMLRHIRAIGFSAAFVAQDGWTEDTTPWDDFDALFVGGTDTFKFGAGANAIQAAKRRGKFVHMGRVNSFKRLRLATVLGCDSADGTFLKFAPDKNEPRMLRWFDKIHSQPTLELAACF